MEGMRDILNISKLRAFSYMYIISIIKTPNLIRLTDILTDLCFLEQYVQLNVLLCLPLDDGSHDLFFVKLFANTYRSYQVLGK